jgi:sec-independent protein translocase protein TatA
MGGASIWHWIVVGLIVMLLFGRGKISEMMGDVAKGIKAFKKGMADDDTAPAASGPVSSGPVAQPGNEPVRTIEHQSAAGTPSPATSEHKVG